MNERFDGARGEEWPPRMDPHVHALRAAYRRGRILVSADPGALARARVDEGHAIDAREVADAMLRRLLRGSPD